MQKLTVWLMGFWCCGWLWLMLPISDANAAGWELQPDGQYRLDGDTVRVTVDPLHGGRITDFRLWQDSLWGDNILLPDTVEPETYGSTFWLSPQSNWNWPPDATIDRLPYKAIITGETLTLESGVSPTLGIQVSKHIHPEGNGIRLDYDIHPVSQVNPTSPLFYAPWEVSRVAGSGLTLFPVGSGLSAIQGFDPPPILQAQGIAVWDHQAQQITAIAEPRDQKLFADGAGGWLAHVDGGVLFVKQFPDLPPDAIAPGESEIEVYATASQRYLELEVQGPYDLLREGTPQTWTVQWQLRSLPPALVPMANNPQFLDWIRHVVKGSHEKNYSLQG
ncbi:MAG: DUF4380 domain-containing protein [Prochlorotrichaceae cyanobacterium]|jgi:hypothetical protein